MQSVPEEWREGGPGGEHLSPRNVGALSDSGMEGEETKAERGTTGDKETLMTELSRLVQSTLKESSWWEMRGVDCSILVGAFLCLPPAFLLLGSSQPLCFAAGVLLMGLAHGVLSIKGTHLASHGALSESHTWAEIWAVFFIEICGSFIARTGVQNHVKMHHAHTNIIGLGDSSTWKVPCLPRSVYLFIAPLALPIITPLVALGYLRDHSVPHATRSVLMVALGFYSQYWLLLHVSGFRSPCGTLLCMLVCRAMFSMPYIHVNIFQHIGLPMFSAAQRPKRIHQMTQGVLNLPRNPLLDWVFGHSLINCHVEHHLFPFLSDHMCLKIKPIVSSYLKEKKLPYQEDRYFSRLSLFFHRYQELMVFAPPITRLAGVQ
ncbi:hypothetical protein NHX12_025586 [Muraenolepis orangiensis]|uniref:Fatty acid desaturase domain-containing protein n=1 Tax=Muraenolepis orangiensis TaxID=630683 RepID=A0A9Q0EJS1_9TELE|nr:hypothetical protein NHX12_025586 [Muraenolepis orangiensis]